MYKVIPVVNCHAGDFECVAGHLQIIETLPQPTGDAWVHVDIADGVFTPHKTWNSPSEWMGLARPLNLEVHLMVENPGFEVDAWLGAGARRLIVHVETLSADSFHVIADKVKRAGAEIMLSTNPETDIKKTEPYWNDVSGFQVLAVHPGLAGQKFLPLVLQKVFFLREKMPSATIEVDGGVTDETGRAAVAAGADVIVSSAYLFDDGDPKKAYENLLHLL